jgi:hypothetical protein
MRSFAADWPDVAIVQEALAQIGWSQNLALLDKQRLAELIDVIATIELTAASEGEQTHRSVDLLGRGYEYFLTRFASAEENIGGQFYTQITGNLQQSRTLATLRDTLLPRLLSRELSVKTAQALAEKAA